MYPASTPTPAPKPAPKTADELPIPKTVLLRAQAEGRNVEEFAANLRAKWEKGDAATRRQVIDAMAQVEDLYAPPSAVSRRRLIASGAPAEAPLKVTEGFWNDFGRGLHNALQRAGKSASDVWDSATKNGQELKTALAANQAIYRQHELELSGLAEADLWDHPNLYNVAAGLGQGIGSTAGALGGAAVGAGVGALYGNVPGLVVGAGVGLTAGFVQGFGEVLDEMTAAGVDPDEARNWAAGVGLVMGATEALPVWGYGKALLRPVRDRLTRGAMKEAAARFGQQVAAGRLPQEALEETIRQTYSGLGQRVLSHAARTAQAAATAALPEGLTEGTQNVIKQLGEQLYDKTAGTHRFADRIKWNEVFTDAAMGALVGGTLGAGGGFSPGHRESVYGLLDRAAARGDAEGQVARLQAVFDTHLQERGVGEDERQAQLARYGQQLTQLAEVAGYARSHGLDQAEARHHLFQLYEYNGALAQAQVEAQMRVDTAEAPQEFSTPLDPFRGAVSRLEKAEAETQLQAVTDLRTVVTEGMQELAASKRINPDAFNARLQQTYAKYFPAQARVDYDPAETYEWGGKRYGAVEGSAQTLTFDGADWRVATPEEAQAAAQAKAAYAAVPRAVEKELTGTRADDAPELSAEPGVQDFYQRYRRQIESEVEAAASGQQQDEATRQRLLPYRALIKARRKELDAGEKAARAEQKRLEDEAESARLAAEKALAARRKDLLRWAKADLDSRLPGATPLLDSLAQLTEGATDEERVAARREAIALAWPQTEKPLAKLSGLAGGRALTGAEFGGLPAETQAALHLLARDKSTPGPERARLLGELLSAYQINLTNANAEPTTPRPDGAGSYDEQAAAQNTQQQHAESLDAALQAIDRNEQGPAGGPAGGVPAAVRRAESAAAALERLAQQTSEDPLLARLAAQELAESEPIGADDDTEGSPEPELALSEPEPLPAALEPQAGRADESKAQSELTGQPGPVPDVVPGRAVAGRTVHEVTGPDGQVLGVVVKQGTEFIATLADGTIVGRDPRQIQAEVKLELTLEDMGLLAPSEQRSAPGSPLSAEESGPVLALLRAAMPGVTALRIPTQEDADAIWGEIVGVPGQRAPLAFVDNRTGIAWLTPRATRESFVHEFGHLWMEAIRQQRPDLHARGLELALADGALMEEVALEYPELSGEALAAEALARLIGRRGDELLSSPQSGLLQQVRQWLEEVWGALKSALGLAEEVDLEALTLQEFVDLAAAELTGGREITRLASRELAQADGPIVSQQKAPPANPFAGTFLDSTNRRATLDPAEISRQAAGVFDGLAKATGARSVLAKALFSRQVGFPLWNADLMAAMSGSGSSLEQILVGTLRASTERAAVLGIDQHYRWPALTKIWGKLSTHGGLSSPELVKKETVSLLDGKQGADVSLPVGTLAALYATHLSQVSSYGRSSIQAGAGTSARIKPPGQTKTLSVSMTPAQLQQLAALFESGGKYAAEFAELMAIFNDKNRTALVSQTYEAVTGKPFREVTAYFATRAHEPGESENRARGLRGLISEKGLLQERRAMPKVVVIEDALTVAERYLRETEEFVELAPAVTGAFQWVDAARRAGLGDDERTALLVEGVERWARDVGADQKENNSLTARFLQGLTQLGVRSLFSFKAVTPVRQAYGFVAAYRAGLMDDKYLNAGALLVSKLTVASYEGWVKGQDDSGLSVLPDVEKNYRRELEANPYADVLRLRVYGKSDSMTPGVDIHNTPSSWRGATSAARQAWRYARDRIDNFGLAAMRRADAAVFYGFYEAAKAERLDQTGDITSDEALRQIARRATDLAYATNQMYMRSNATALARSNDPWDKLFGLFTGQQQKVLSLLGIRFLQSAEAGFADPELERQVKGVLGVGIVGQAAANAFITLAFAAAGGAALAGDDDDDKLAQDFAWEFSRALLGSFPSAPTALLSAATTYVDNATWENPAGMQLALGSIQKAMEAAGDLRGYYDADTDSQEDRALGNFLYHLSDAGSRLSGLPNAPAKKIGKDFGDFMAGE